MQTKIKQKLSSAVLFLVIFQLAVSQILPVLKVAWGKLNYKISKQTNPLLCQKFAYLTFSHSWNDTSLLSYSVFHCREALKLSKEKFIIMIKYAIYTFLLCCWKLWHISKQIEVKKKKTKTSTKQMQTLTEQVVVLCSLSMLMKLSVSGRLQMGSIVIF